MNHALKASRNQKLFARGVAALAVRHGLLEQPRICSKCLMCCRPHAHHDDYDKPMDVRWLCPGCHQEWHANVRRVVKKLIAAQVEPR